MKKTLNIFLSFIIAISFSNTLLAENEKVFNVHEVPTAGYPAIPTHLDRALDALDGEEGVLYTVPTINFRGGSSNRFIDNSTFRLGPDLFALEATGTVNISNKNKIMTFAVGSDDGFRLEIEGGTFIGSSQTPGGFQGSTTVIDGNVMHYDGLRSPNESYGVFEFDKPGNYEVSLVFFEDFGLENLEFSAAPGDHLGDIPNAPFELVNSESKSALQLLPNK